MSMKSGPAELQTVVRAANKMRNELRDRLRTYMPVQYIRGSKTCPKCSFQPLTFFT